MVTLKSILDKYISYASEESSQLNVAAAETMYDNLIALCYGDLELIRVIKSYESRFKDVNINSEGIRVVLEQIRKYLSDRI